jgi:NADH:ubiquinone oxidoreductase subunit E
MKTILVCVHERFSATAPSCGARGGKALVQELSARVEARGLALEIRPIHCFGQCVHGPNCRALGEAFHHGVQLGDVERLLDEWSA